MNRWLSLGGLAAVAIGVVTAGGLAPHASAAPLDPAALTKYIDPLPIPPVAQQSAPGHYDMTMMQGTTQFSSQLSATPVWGYGGGYLGPTIEERTGNPITVTWINNLPTAHLLAPFIDYTLDGAMQGPDVRAVTHLHGGHVAAGERRWARRLVPAAASRPTYAYPNDQDATTLWYHDHAMGITRLNRTRGWRASTSCATRDEDCARSAERRLRDPARDPGQAVRHRRARSAIRYQGIDVHPVWLPEFFGDTIVVNGKVVAVPERRAAQVPLPDPQRLERAVLLAHDRRAERSARSRPAFNQIGSEGGLCPRPRRSTQLLIAPGERADVIVDFANDAGTDARR